MEDQLLILLVVVLAIRFLLLELHQAIFFFFFYNDTPTTEISPLPLHDALPILGGGQSARGKSFDGFCPLAPAIVTRDQIPTPNALKLRTILNGQVMQDHTTADMIFDVPALIESLSSTMTLRPGAIILTGTPHGVGFARKPPVWLKWGDTIAVELEKIGRLENPVVAEG